MLYCFNIALNLLWPDIVLRVCCNLVFILDYYELLYESLWKRCVTTNFWEAKYMMAIFPYCPIAKFCLDTNITVNNKIRQTTSTQLPIYFVNKICTDVYTSIAYNALHRIQEFIYQLYIVRKNSLLFKMAPFRLSLHLISIRL